MISTICLSLLACSSASLCVPKTGVEQSIKSIQTLPQTNEDTIRIYFIRNGESAFSAKDENGTKFTSGKSREVRLNASGIEQANTLKEALHSMIHNVAIFTPPAARAEETANILSSEEDGIVMGGVYEGLLEVGMGDWEGKPKDQQYLNEYAKWKALPAADKYVTPKVGGGESYFEASERAMRDLAAIVDSEQQKTLFIVSGENLLNALAIRWTHPDLSRQAGSDLPMLPMENCGLYLIEIPRGASIEDASFKMLFHLAK